MNKLPFSTCKEVAELISGKLIGINPCQIKCVNRIEDATAGDLTFLSDSKYMKYLETSYASCIIISEKIYDRFKQEIIDENKNYILVENAYESFLIIINLIEKYYEKNKSEKQGIHPTALIGKNCNISESAFIGPYCVIGDNSSIGKNCIIEAHTVIYEDVLIEEDTKIDARVVIYRGVVIGKRCNILAGAVIGSDGFGFIENSDKSYTRIPQIGNVVIEDDVEIGANTTIDRALFGSTVLEKGVKLDNLIQIAHNVRVGENTGMASQVGISGSTNIGKRNRFGGQVGLAGHLETADDVSILAQSGVAGNIDKSGIYIGSPVNERMTGFRIYAAINNLPELVHEVRNLKKEIQKLKEAISGQINNPVD